MSNPTTSEPIAVNDSVFAQDPSLISSSPIIMTTPPPPVLPALSEIGWINTWLTYYFVGPLIDLCTNATGTAGGVAATHTLAPAAAAGECVTGPLNDSGSTDDEGEKGFQESTASNNTKPSHDESGAPRTLRIDDLFKLGDRDSLDDLIRRFDEARSQGDDPTAYFKPAFGTAKELIFAAGCFQLLRAGGDVVLPIFIKNVIQAIEDRSFDGLYWCIAIFLTAAVIQVSNQIHLRLMDVAMMRLRAVTVFAVYRHSMTLLPRTFPSMQAEVATLIASDAQRYIDVGPHIQLLWASPLQIILSTYVLVSFLDWPATIAVGVMFMMYPISIGLSTIQGRVRRKLLPFTKERTRLVAEYLRGVKVIKLYGWEPHLRRLIDTTRTKELSLLKYELFIFCLNMMCLIAIGHIAAAAGFSVFIAVEGVLTAPNAFATLAVLTLMKFPIMFFGHSALYAVQCKVGIERIQTFLRMKNEDQQLPAGTSSISGANASSSSSTTTAAEGDAAVLHPQQEAAAAPPFPLPLPVDVASPDADGDAVLSLQNARFVWSSNESSLRSSFQLHVPGFSLRAGETAAVMGPVGSGKSMLCSSILRETLQVDGVTKVPSTVAYAAQEPFLISGTIRDNIVFRGDFDADLYRACLDACQLWQDVESYPDGEMTVVGERGVTLSGGQKARIALARAAYDRSSLVLLDDPFSALDARTGAMALEALLGPGGLMSKKAVLFVTHAKQNLRFATVILHAHKSGLIERAELDEVISSPSLASPSPAGLDPLVEETPSSPTIVRNRQLRSGVKDALVSAEESRTGTVSLSTYWEYCVAAGGLPFIIILTLGLAVERFVFIGIDFWLAVWTSAENGKPTHALADHFPELPEGNTTDGSLFYAKVYIVMVCMVLLFSLLRLVWAVHGGHRQYRRLFDDALDQLMRCPMVFFDTTPAGRILNRMAHDVERTGYPLITQMAAYYATLWWILAGIAVICAVVPIALAVVLPTLAITCWYLYRFRTANVHFQRLDAMARSSVQSHITETIGGAATIRAFQRVDDFIDGCKEHLNASNRAIYCFAVAQRWAGMRAELLGVLTISVVPLFCWVMRSSISPNAAGVAILWGMHLPRSVTFAMTEGIQGEAKLVSVERLVDYGRDLPQEPPRCTSDGVRQQKLPAAESAAAGGRGAGVKSDESCDEGLTICTTTNAAAASSPVPCRTNWPTDGKIELCDVAMRYRPNLPLVLDGATVTIAAGERVGIIGRTGAGKSSIIVAMFRLRELTRGCIKIDGEDISQVGLDAIRGGRIGIIPQDPVLFSGTVRSNVDPFGVYSNEEVESALSTVQLLDIANANGGLDAEVGDDGGDWSVGQRQLFCVARALISKPRVLLMDEATANVDSATDLLIQEMVRRLFKGTTVVEIAHRLHTVMDADKVCVMSNGAVREFDTPFQLLQDPDSEFSQAVDATGATVAAELKQVAKETNRQRSQLQ